MCGYILAEQRPDVRETQAASFGPGSVVPPFLCSTLFNPFNPKEVFHVRNRFPVPLRQVRRARPALPSRLQAHPFRRRSRRASAPRVALAVPMPPRVVVAGWQQVGIGGGIMASYRLTSPRTLGHVGHPNCKRRIRRLCHCFPGMVKRADFLDPCHRCTLFLRVRLDIRQGDVRVSVRPRKPLTGLGASPCLFYLRRSTIPNCKRCRMISRVSAEVG